MSESHRFKGGTTDEAFQQQCFLWERGASVGCWTFKISLNNKRYRTENRWFVLSGKNILTFLHSAHFSCQLMHHCDSCVITEQMQEKTPGKTQWPFGIRLCWRNMFLSVFEDVTVCSHREKRDQWVARGPVISYRARRAGDLSQQNDREQTRWPKIAGCKEQLNKR